MEIKFCFPDGSTIPGFEYDWRLWNITELRECAQEAGFCLCSVWLNRTRAESAESDQDSEKGVECTQDQDNLADFIDMNLYEMPVKEARKHRHKKGKKQTRERNRRNKELGLNWKSGEYNSVENAIQSDYWQAMIVCYQR